MLLFYSGGVDGGVFFDDGSCIAFSWKTMMINALGKGKRGVGEGAASVDFCAGVIFSFQTSNKPLTMSAQQTPKEMASIWFVERPTILDIKNNLIYIYFNQSLLM